MFGVSDIDQRLCPLLEVFPEKVYFPIFRHDPVYVSPCGDDAGTFFEEGNDPGDAG